MFFPERIPDDISDIATEVSLAMNKAGWIKRDLSLDLNEWASRIQTEESGIIEASMGGNAKAAGRIPSAALVVGVCWVTVRHGRYMVTYSGRESCNQDGTPPSCFRGDPMSVIFRNRYRMVTSRKSDQLRAAIERVGCGSILHLNRNRPVTLIDSSSRIIAANHHALIISAKAKRYTVKARQGWLIYNNRIESLPPRFIKHETKFFRKHQSSHRQPLLRAAIALRYPNDMRDIFDAVETAEGR